MIRIGVVIGPHDPYWVQVRETVYQRVEQLGATLIPLEISDTNETLYSLDPAWLAEEFLSQELDAIISQSIPLGVLYQLIYSGIPVVMLGESQLQHHLFCSPSGLYQAAQTAAEYIGERLKGQGRVLCVGGLLDYGEDKGVSRISGFCDTLRQFPDMSVIHCPTAWRYDQAYPLVLSLLRELGSPVDAIFGISDSLALAGLDALRYLGGKPERTVIVGLNGDPLALAAIAEGSMAATVETCAVDLGRRSADLAYGAAQGEPLPRYYPHTIRLITSENVNQHAVRKLIAIAKLPSYLVGVNREQERHRLIQLETSAAINQRVGSLLDRSQLSREIADLIRVNYGFDHVQMLIWSEREQMLFPDGTGGKGPPKGIPLEESGLLGEVIRNSETIFIPDTRYSHRFAPDPNWPNTRSRVVLPIRLGGKVIGLLDLHSVQPIANLRWELIGLQLLADQFGIALRNAELYSEALQARESAERADQLKTRLLANVSHELRTPLNVILGYSQTALNTPNLYGIDLPQGLCQDLRYIYQSGEHLIRIINDLLDLSRAEIGELNVFPENMDIDSFLKEIFASMSRAAAHEKPDVEWKLDIPPRLPVIQADPVRLRQILLNLLSNAQKFTQEGCITLGAEVEPPYLHLWVSDSGSGISVDQQARIFEPFITTETPSRRREGIGLGLPITRRLVALHGGSMSLESQPNFGSTFHVYLPLPNLAGSLALPPEVGARPALLLVTSPVKNRPGDLPEEIARIAACQNLEICPVAYSSELEPLLREVRPVVIAWDSHAARRAEWSVIQQLRRHPHLSTLPFILLGETSPDPLHQPIGVTNVLLKPLNGQNLLNLIESQFPSGASGCVLIVDDDPQARALYLRLVEEAMPGYTVRLVENGALALEALEEEIPALILLDLIMPGVDGFEVLRRVRTNPLTSKVPVLVLSGKLLTYEDVRRLDFAGVVFHSKDILSSEEILELFRNTCSDSTGLGQSTSLLVKQALAYLHQNYDQPLSRSELAEAVGVSENYLSQIFRQELGLSPLECINRLRIRIAKELLLCTSDPVTSIAARVGFDDPAYFSRVFRKLCGCSPQSYRQKTPKN